MANYYPYWEGISIESALSTLDAMHKKVVAAAGGKTVIVSETGWPSGGDTVGNAEPSLDNEVTYFGNFVSWARDNTVAYYYFEAFDENWKASYEGPQGAHWGVWDAAGNMKNNMSRIFD